MKVSCSSARVRFKVPIFNRAGTSIGTSIYAKIPRVKSMNRKRLIPALLLLAGLIAVLPGSLFSQTSSFWPSSPAEAERIRQLNDIARFCAGLKVDDRSELCDLTKTKEWAKFAAGEDERWEFFRMKEGKMRPWAESYVSPRLPSSRVVFYPFGGPDILYADVFMPSADLYILIGLEDAGAAPRLEGILKSRLKVFLGNYSQAFNDLMRSGFFRRLEMMSELSSETIKGVLPICLVLLARMGKELVSVETGGLSETGEFLAAPEGSQPPPKAFRLRYLNPQDGIISTVVYFSQDLSNAPFEKNKALGALLARNLPNCYTIIKSASYLMHNYGFSAIRNMILQYSDAVLQDDSGVLFKLFDPKVWTLNLHGVYNGPTKQFGEYFEPALCQAFQGGGKPLSFRYGYELSSNLLWAVKKIQ